MVGGRGENDSSRPEPPISSVSSSETILTTCWPGLSWPMMSEPSARSLTALVKLLTTLKLTSASSSARRISRMAELMSASVSVPRPRTSARVACSFSARESNMGRQVLRLAAGGRIHPGGAGIGDRLRVRRLPLGRDRIPGGQLLGGAGTIHRRRLVAAGARTAGERPGDPAERLGELRRDDEHLVRIALGQLREHLQVLVAEQLRVRLALVDGAEHGGDRLGLALGSQGRRLLVALGGEHGRLLLPLGLEDLGLLD